VKKKFQNLHPCRVCDQDSNYLWSSSLIGNRVKYYECALCGYVQTEEPYWLNDAYKESINLTDTGILSRNLFNLKITISTLVFLNIRNNAKVVDAAGGYGVLVRLLRDYGINAFWSDKYSHNLFARGFEYENMDSPADLVTVFEAFEHFSNPNSELDNLLSIAPNVLLSTQIIPDKIPKPNAWWYYGLEHGQHVGFFRIKTLQKLAFDREKYLLSDGRSFHLITEKKSPLWLWTSMLKFRSLIFMYAKRYFTSKTLEDHMHLKNKTS
jgi:Zn ribbon nucleic-acid-binding protein